MTVPHYGKRNAGLLTAASPGDTLHFNFASYNDSGDSEALTGFAVADIEVFKNGLATARATDSGYSLISDTGQIGDRVGLYRFSIQLFNTADDANFYASGGWYQVAVDSVSIDGKTVRAWVGSFEIGEPRANVVQMSGDTGAADVLRKFAATNGTLSPAGELDTGSVTDGSAVAANALRVDSDTGAADRLGKFAGLQLKTDGTLDTGTGQTTNTLNITATATTDTGQVNNAVWNGARAAHTVAGSFGQYANANLVAVLTDTGAAHLDAGRLGVSAAATVDTGQVNQAVWQANAARGITAIADTGMNERFGRIQSDVDTGLRTHINDLDTGLHDTLSDYDTGVRALLTLRDTGAVANAVWGFATRAVTNVTGFSDTGVNERLGRIQSDVDTGLRVHIDDLDTGLHAHIGDVDTGLHSILQSVGVLVSAISDTGVNDRLGDIQTKTDNLTFTVAGQVDANIQYVNDVAIAGTGDTGTGNTWRPA
jgi:hypothetical protein